MSIFPTIAVTPIYLPQRQFRDSYGNPNAYIPMNPSMHITPEGEVTLLIRSVNYRKYKDKQFTLYEKPWSTSSYTILRGQMTANRPFQYDGFKQDELVLEYNQPTYSSYWKGMEDIRFIKNDQVLVTIPEFNPGGNPSIFMATIDSNRISFCIPCEPSITEKNWMPYDEENPMVIYSVEPFLIKEILDPEFTTVDTNLSLKGYHGSTNGIPFKDGFQLFLIHTSRDISYHRWLLFHPDTHATRVSSEFIFFRNTYIEFPCSLCQWDGRIFLSLGVNDDSAFIVEVTVADIMNSFHP
jgi:hypothetical protein